MPQMYFMESHRSLSHKRLFLRGTSIINLPLSGCRNCEMAWASFQGHTSLYRMSGFVLCRMRVKPTNCCPPGCFCAAVYVAYLHA